MLYIYHFIGEIHLIVFDRQEYLLESAGANILHVVGIESITWFLFKHDAHNVLILKVIVTLDSGRRQRYTVYRAAVFIQRVYHNLTVYG